MEKMTRRKKIRREKGKVKLEMKRPLHWSRVNL